MACSSDNELRIIMIGKTGTGKSSTANTILQKKCFDAAPGGSSITQKSQLRDAKIFGRSVIIVDTPGLYDTHIEEGETLKEIVRSIAMVTPGPHAILFVLQIGRCTEQEINTINTFMAHFGEYLRKYVITIFTRYDDWKRDTNDSFRNYIDTLPSHAKKFIQETCNGRFIPIDNTLTGNTSEQQARAVIQVIDEMVLRNGGESYSDANFREAERIKTEKEEEALQKLKKIEEQRENEIKIQIEQQLEEQRKQWKEDKNALEQEYRRQTAEILKSERELFENEIKMLRSSSAPNGIMNTMIDGLKIVNGITDTVNSLLNFWDKTQIHVPQRQYQPPIPWQILLNQQQALPDVYYQRSSSLLNYGNFLICKHPDIGDKCHTSDEDVN